MKALMLGACLAVLGAPALAQPYEQDQADPYYDQGPPPQSAQPPVQRGYDGRYDQPNGYGQYQPPPYAQGNGDEDENSDDDAAQGYDQYQPPPAPPPGQPGFQYYQDNPPGGYGADQQDYGEQSAPYGYQGYGGGGQLYGYHGYPRSYGAGPGANYTGETRGVWRNAQGQYCVWREMTWQDQYGRQAHRWVPRCR